MTRSKQQLVGHKRRRNAVLVLDKGDQPYSPVVNRVRLQNQTEARLRQWSVVSNLYGLSGRRILEALAEGETDPEKLADLGDDRLKCGRETLVDALSGRSEPIHREILKLSMQRLKLAAGALEKHADSVTRLAEVPGFGVDSAQQVIAEIGADAKAQTDVRDVCARRPAKVRRSLLYNGPCGACHHRRSSWFARECFRRGASDRE
jgi:hypothetical protein